MVQTEISEHILEKQSKKQTLSQNLTEEDTLPSVIDYQELNNMFVKVKRITT